jgi:hypothetical protein
MEFYNVEHEVDRERDGEGGAESETLRRVYEKFSQMRRTLEEIEAWLDSRRDRPRSARRPDLTFATLGVAVLREDSRPSRS